MKILQIIPNLNNGGAERFVCELSNALSDIAEIQCTLLTLYNRTDEDEQLSSTLCIKVKNVMLNKKSGFDFSVFFRLYKFIKKQKFDVVHAHVGAIKYITLAAILLPQTRFIATIHSEAKREAGESIDKYSRRVMFRQKLCIPVTISSESRLSFLDFYKRDAVLIHNGISAYKFNKEHEISRKPGELLFIHPASCQPIKNQELLLRAFTRLSQSFPYVKLIWIGNKTACFQLFDRLSTYLSENILYEGVVENVRDYLFNADAMCLSSKMEGMPMSILEAFSVGCIPLVTPVGGCKNMIQNGVNGFLSDSLSEEDYYQMLKRFVELTENEKTNIKNAAMNSFLAYNIENAANEYYRLYQT